MKKTLLLALPVLLFASLIGCTKDGATGPAGPAGAQGPTGASGSVVLKTDSFYVTTAMWVANGANDWTINLTATDITANIVNDGTVEAFIYSASAGEWFAMNDVVAGGSGFRYAYKAGTFTLFADNFSSAPVAYPFKAVLIPGSVMKQHPTTNWKDYNQVTALLATQSK